MTHVMTEIRFLSDLPSEYNFTDGVFESLTKINYFVGQNNCGKSRLMRRIFKDANFAYNSLKVEELVTFIKDQKNLYEQIIDPYTSIDGINADSFDALLRGLTSDNYLQVQSTIFIDIENFFKKLLNMTATNYGPVSREPNILNDSDRIEGVLDNLRRDYKSLLSNFSQISKIKNDFQERIYVPTLRSVKSFSINGQDISNIFVENLRRDYFPNLDKKQVIFSGQEIYTQTLKMLLGKPRERQKIRDLETFISQKFFSGQEVVLIPEYETKTLEIKIGDADQFPVHDLGDGIQNILICIFAIFFANENSLIFIEEPETNSHPGFQKALVDCMKLFPNQYFLTTHSTNLLDYSNKDCSIFHFKRNTNQSFSVEKSSFGSKNILESLGVYSSSVFLANSSIWLEGITDMKYLKVYLERYKEYCKASNNEMSEKLEKLIEGIHYCFTEYSGSNLTHWEFEDNENSELFKSEFIFRHVLVICDGDISSKADKKSKLEQSLGENLLILPCKEIENLIPAVVIEKILRDDYLPKSLSDIDLSDIKYEVYSENSEGLGFYLSNILQPKLNGNKLRKKISEDSGTIFYKTDFCLAAVEVLKTCEVSQIFYLDSQIEKLMKKIVNHILLHNNL